MFDLEKYLKELETFVNMDSGSLDMDDVERAAEWLAAKYKEAGLFVTLSHQGEGAHPHIIATTKEPAEVTGEKPVDIMFIGHFDTVFPHGTAAERPFRIDERNLAHGPGAMDMKAGILLTLEIVKELRRRRPDASIAIVNNSDEELGSPDTSPALMDFAGKAKFAFDMEPGRANGNFVKERKGAAEYWIDFHGIASHAGSAPEKGASAVKEMAKWIIEFDKYHDLAAGRTVSAGIVTGGSAANVIPEEARMKVDLRYLVDSQRDEFDAALANLAANPFDSRVKVAIEKFSDMPPMQFNEGTRHMVAILEEEMAKLGQNYGFESSGGASDASFVSGAGTPIVDACGPHGDGAHSSDEVMMIDTVRGRYDLLLATCERLLQE